MSDWMGTPQAAEYLGLALRTLYKLIDHGRIPAYRMGRVIRVRRSDLDAYIEDSRIEPGELDYLYSDPDAWEPIEPDKE